MPLFAGSAEKVGGPASSPRLSPGNPPASAKARRSSRYTALDAGGLRLRPWLSAPVRRCSPASFLASAGMHPMVTSFAMGCMPSTWWVWIMSASAGAAAAEQLPPGAGCEMGRLDRCTRRAGKISHHPRRLAAARVCGRGDRQDPGWKFSAALSRRCNSRRAHPCAATSGRPPTPRTFRAPLRARHPCRPRSLPKADRADRWWDPKPPCERPHACALAGQVAPCRSYPA